MGIDMGVGVGALGAKASQIFRLYTDSEIHNIVEF